MNLRHTILVIDDTVRLASALVTALTKEGYAVHALGGAGAALEYLRQHEAPTFILADRMLGEPIEVRDLDKLCKAAPTSKILVYTAKEDLSPEQQFWILKKGAYRVLDKTAVDQLVKDIKVLTQELDELLELSTELGKTTLERSKIIAALVGADVAVTVVDRHFHRWFRNSTQERLGGSVCRDRCWTASFSELAGQGTCWGCTISDVFRTKTSIERLILNRFPDGSVRWVVVRSTPIIGSASNAIIAAREAFTEVSESALAGVPIGQRLRCVGESLIRAGFGRARIYRAISDGKIRLVDAVARSDSPQNARSDYLQQIKDLTIEVDGCPYMRLARHERVGSFVPSWDPKLGASPFAKTLLLDPPYFDVPIWSDDKRLEGWIALDFVEMDGVLARRAIELNARKESLSWLQGEFGREVRKAFEVDGGKPEHRRKFEIAQRARLGIAGAKSVADATRELREAFGNLLPRCRVSVRMCSGGNLCEFESLCWGARVESVPSILALEDKRALTAYVVSTQIPLWIPSYAEYLVGATERGDPTGYPPKTTRSTAQIPLRFENTVFGTLSIDSPEQIQWDIDGYKEPILMLARDTALVLRDLALHEELDQAMAVRAAMTAYSASLSSDALWRHWAQQRLAEASALIARVRRSLDNNGEVNIEQADRLLAQASTVITRVHVARPVEEVALPTCTLSQVFLQLSEIYSDHHPRPKFSEPHGTLRLKVPAFILRNILMVLLDNSIRAIKDSGFGSLILVNGRFEAENLFVDVVDDGPGIDPGYQTLILREPIPSRVGRGVGLLYARGAALQFRGDLGLSATEHGTHFSLRLPAELDSGAK